MNDDIDAVVLVVAEVQELEVVVRTLERWAAEVDAADAQIRRHMQSHLRRVRARLDALEKIRLHMQDSDLQCAGHA